MKSIGRIVGLVGGLGFLMSGGFADIAKLMSTLEIMLSVCRCVSQELR